MHKNFENSDRKRFQDHPILSSPNPDLKEGGHLEIKDDTIERRVLSALDIQRSIRIPSGLPSVICPSDFYLDMKLLGLLFPVGIGTRALQ